MIEHRGITCMACINLDLKANPDQARMGWGTCTVSPPVTFVRMQQSRNCKDYETADPEVVELRDTWAASNIKLPAWQR